MIEFLFDVGCFKFSYLEELHSHALFLCLFSGNPDYASSVSAAASAHWASDETGARFVFTSSAGVYKEDAGGVVDENSEVKHSEYLDKILVKLEISVDFIRLVFF